MEVRPMQNEVETPPKQLKKQLAKQRAAAVRPIPGSDLGYAGDLLKTVPPGPPRARPAPPSPLNTY